MKADSIAATLTMSVLLLAAASSRVRQAGLYIEIAPPVAGANGAQSVDIIVGNRGDLVSRDNFDAIIEAERNGKPLCSASTNFVTPIAPGESIRALRLQVAGPPSRTLEKVAIRAAIRPWDHARSGPHQQIVIPLSPGHATCVALKPMQ